MDDKKNKQKKDDPNTMKKTTTKNTKPEIKDIDDLIFADEFIKKHSEK